MSVTDPRWMATQLELLDALLRSPTRRASLGESSGRFRDAFPDRGPWRGSAVKELKKDGLIRQVGAMKAQRPTRKSSVVWLWEIADYESCRKRANRLREMLDAKNEKSPSAATGGQSDGEVM